MPGNLADGMFGEPPKIRFGRAVARLNGHALNHSADEAGEGGSIRFGPDLTIPHALLDATAKQRQRCISQVGYQPGHYFVFHGTRQNGRRDHTATRLVRAGEIPRGLPQHPCQRDDGMAFLRQRPHGCRPFVIAIPRQRFRIERSLGTEGGVKALWRNAHRQRQIHDGGALITQLPENVGCPGKRLVPVKGTGAATGAGSCFNIIHNDRSGNIGVLGLFGSGHCDYRELPAMSLANNARSGRLNAVIDAALAEKRIVGAVVLVAERGESVYARAAGLADREAGIAMREDAIFRLASITKPIVSAATMRLVDDGVLSLDQPVTRWLPDFRPRLADGSGPVITIRQLLTHTSGLGYRFLKPACDAYHALDISDGMDQPGLSLTENLARLAAAPLAFAPGEGWLYSLGLDVLGGVLERATGLALPELVRTLVTAPLQLADTGFTVADPARLVTPYANADPEPVRMTEGMAVSLGDTAAIFAPGRILDSASYPSGGAGLAGTAGDVLRFLEVIRTGGAPILAPETVTMMMAAHVGAGAQTQGPGWGFGYGWAVLVDPVIAATPQAAGTLQWGGAYGHTWFVDRVNGLSVVVLTNTAFEGMAGALKTQIRNAVYN